MGEIERLKDPGAAQKRLRLGFPGAPGLPGRVAGRDAGEQFRSFEALKQAFKRIITILKPLKRCEN